MGGMSIGNLPNQSILTKINDIANDVTGLDLEGVNNLKSKLSNLVAPELGNSDEKAISQKVVTTNIQQLNTEVNNKINKVESAQNGNLPSFDNGNIKDSKIPASNIAQQNGYYEGMVVGASRSLAGDNEVRAEYVFRPSGGADIQSGTASINKVLGKTLVWNQLIKNGNFADGENNWIIETFSIPNNPYYDVTINNNIISLTKKEFNYARLRQLGNVIINHKYLYKFDFWTNGIAPYNANDNLGASFVANVQINSSQYKDVNVWTSVKGIITSTNSLENSNLFFALGGGVGEGHELKFKNIQLFDLTQMFGEGNEPTTVEEFEAMFPNDYYEYNEGTLISNDAVGIKSVGFNAWDEDVISGYYSNVDGVYVNDKFRLCSKNPTKVIPNGIYYLTAPIRTYLQGYDENMNYIGIVLLSHNVTITIPDNVHWIHFGIIPDYGTTYNNDICINLSHSGIRDGEYEPYEEHKLLFNKGGKLSTIKGKLNGEGESVVVFPDGLRSAGNARDEIVGNVAIKRIGSVDMGSLNWEKNGAVNETIYQYIVRKWDNKIGSTCIYVPQSFIVSLTIRATNGIIVLNSTIISDIITLKQSLQGQILYYELAEPETYILDEAIPMNYVVDDWGTEERLVADENEILAPLCYDVTYAINAVDTIRNMPKNYISEETMQAFLSAVGNAMGGTWSMTWNEDMQKYVFTFAPNAVNVE